MTDSKGSGAARCARDVVEGVRDQRADPDEQEALVSADLDTLATALYVRTDDLLKASARTSTVASQDRDQAANQRR
jgi:hypothetical protein